MFDAGRLKPTRHHVRVPAQLVGCVGTGGQSVPRKVGHEYAPIARQPRTELPPRAVAVVQTMQQHERWLGGRYAQLRPVQSHPFDASESVMPLRGRWRSVAAGHESRFAQRWVDPIRRSHDALRLHAVRQLTEA